MIRTMMATATTVAALALAGCSDQSPLEPPLESPPPVVQHVLQPGTGNPAIDEQLVVLNNQVVACATNGELDYRTASTIALFTAILRFTPSSESSAKVTALLQARTLQLEHAARKDNVSSQCFTQLNATIDGIEALL